MAAPSLDLRQATQTSPPSPMPSRAEPESVAAQAAACHHCGAACGMVELRQEEKSFCCQGCLTVYELLTENGLGHFYDLGNQAGIRVNRAARQAQFHYLDDPTVSRRLLDFSDGKSSRVTLQAPAIHCIACVWLLENLFQLHPGIGESRVNFARKEVSISYRTDQLRLSELVALLSSIGYEPAFNLANLEEERRPSMPRKLWLQLGLAGFAFGNIMLFSITSYLGLDAAAEPGLARLFGGLSMVLALPVLLYSASDYWRSAWTGLRQKVLTIDLPITIGMVALLAQSVFEILSGAGEGYLDSLTGLVFFLLCGKVFQQKTYARMAFDRDYKSFFPLSVVRKSEQCETTVPVSRIQVGDRLVLRNRELIPADSRLAAGHGWIDYSFVTGESDPVEMQPGDYLYAGGQQMGGVIEVETVKPVSQSYLTSLWSHEAFAKKREESLNTLTNRFSHWFTAVVGAIAVGTAVYWGIVDPSRAARAFTAVLIVACPCALALAAPFALGTAQRLLARRSIFLKNPQTIEAMAQLDTIVFDKTGTLTMTMNPEIDFLGDPLSELEVSWVAALTRQSTHPFSQQINAALSGTQAMPDARSQMPDASFHPPSRPSSSKQQPADSTCARNQEATSFQETPGGGVEGTFCFEADNGVSASPDHSKKVLLGSRQWLVSQDVPVPPRDGDVGSLVCLAVEGQYRGCFQLKTKLRPQVENTVRQISRHYSLALLSGDSEKELPRFQSIFGPNAALQFNQSPLDKLNFIRHRQQSGQRVMMVGDGLNDAGALKQSDVGIAVVENVGAFSPASDVIIEALRIPQLPAILRFARGSTRVVYLSIFLSCLYNVAGISVAAMGMLSPVFSAILMPLSSVSVVLFACAATNWVGRREALALSGPRLPKEAVG